jgi:hypothetical protein
MTFDILDLTEQEIKALTTIQLKLLRTAQQKKDALLKQLNEDLQTYFYILCAGKAVNSSLYEQKKEALVKEYNYQLDILVEQLQFNMSLNEPTTDDEVGDSGNDSSAYLVDYSLSYLERYVQVRDYYMTIADPNERLALYAADKVAVEYLNSYYNSLYNYLYSFTTQS